jgi:hypothetical protein
MDRETSDPACARRVLVMDVAGARGRIPQLSEIAHCDTPRLRLEAVPFRRKQHSRGSASPLGDTAAKPIYVWLGRTSHKGMSGAPKGDPIGPSTTRSFRERP